MAGSMAGPRAKLERANRHLHELERSLGGEFFTLAHSTHPYVVLAEDDHETGQVSYKLGKVPPIPPEISAIAGDAVHNLRSALDLLMTQLILAAGETPGREYFPIAETPEKFVARCRAEIEGRITQDALDVLLACEAYRGGTGDALWRVHKLDVEDKHRLLFVFGVVPRSQTLPMPVSDLPAGFREAILPLMRETFFRPADRSVLSEDDVIGTQDIASKAENELRFRLEVAFAEAEIVQGDPVHPTLLQLAAAVGAVVESFARFFH